MTALVNTETGEITESPTPYQLLPRLTDEEFTALKDDIKANGIRVPIDVDESGTVIDGHHRAWIAADLGIECPRRVVAGLTDEQKRAHAIAANVYRRSLSREQRREMVRRLGELGMSTRQIAEVADVSHMTVARDAEDDRGVTDVTPRARVGKDGKTYQPKTVVEQRRQNVAELLAAGFTHAQIADSLGVPHSTVHTDAKVLRDVTSKPSSKSPADTPRKVERIRELAAKAWTSPQIARDLGVGEQRVRELARNNGIDITADKVLGKTRRIDSNHVMQEVVDTLAQLDMPMRVINLKELDAARVSEWANSLTESIRALNRFAKTIKELADE